MSIHCTDYCTPLVAYGRAWARPLQWPTDYKGLKGNLSLLVQGFWYSAWSWNREIQVNPQNSAKFTKTHKMPQNLVEILSNTCLYSICETYPSYWGYLLAVNLQIYLGTLSLNHANNVPKLPGVNCVAKIWALAVMLKALPLVHFWSVLLLKGQYYWWLLSEKC